MAQGAHKITQLFEEELCKYTGAPYAVAVDNESNALFLALTYEKEFGSWDSRTEGVFIPPHTYPSVPCEIIHAGGSVKFSEQLFTSNLRNNYKNEHVKGTTILLKGPYRLWPTCVVDSALRFTGNMYVAGTHMCLSFTGPYKHLKLGKGGAILTDSEEAYKWFKKARFSGRDECSYHEDNFDENPVIGWNFYMPIETAARGLHMMPQFYGPDGTPKTNPDLELPYPDLSKFKLWK